MSVASADVCEGESESGTLLAELERRQDDVLAQLDALDRQLSGLLQGLGVTLVDEADATGLNSAPHAGEDADDETAEVASIAGVLDRLAAESHAASDTTSVGFAKLPGSARAA